MHERAKSKEQRGSKESKVTRSTYRTGLWTLDSTLTTLDVATAENRESRIEISIQALTPVQHGSTADYVSFIIPLSYSSSIIHHSDLPTRLFCLFCLNRRVPSLPLVVPCSLAFQPFSRRPPGIFWLDVLATKTPYSIHFTPKA